MKFESLKEKCEYYRGLGEHPLMPGTYVLAMLDGRSFSKVVKKRFKLPFDDDFVGMMNSTARYLCENVQGVKLAYVQSDEISLLLTDFDEPGMTDSFFGYRNCKLLSILASMATGAFNLELLRHNGGVVPEDFKPVQFDCKVWNVPTWNDAWAWFLYRQIDCVRNSKQQAAQSVLSHKELHGLDTDTQIQRLKDEGKIDWWHDYNDGLKYGRYLWKEKEKFHNEKMNLDYERTVWKVHYGKDLTQPEGREWFDQIKVPRIEYIREGI